MKYPFKLKAQPKIANTTSFHILMADWHNDFDRRDEIPKIRKLAKTKGLNAAARRFRYLEGADMATKAEAREAVKYIARGMR